MNRTMENSNQKKCDLFNIKMWELEMILEPWELGAVLRKEKNCFEVDIMLENMLSYYVEEEKYSYCIIIRDEVNRRKKMKNPLK